MKHTALITGASSGIGKALATIHAKNGGHLVLVARRKDKLKTLKQNLETQYSIKVMIIVKDLTLPNAPKEVYKAIQQAQIKIDYLINNAGFGGIGLFHTQSLEYILNMVTLNIRALTELTHIFLQDFVQLNQGRVLNVSSTASLMPGPMQAVYFATKAYVSSFSNALSEELSHTNITVTNLMPGATQTEFGKRSGMDKTVLFKNATNPKKVAKDGYNGMLKGKLNVTSGLTWHFNLLITCIPFFPKKLVLKTVKYLQQTQE